MVLNIQYQMFLWTQNKSYHTCSYDLCHNELTIKLNWPAAVGHICWYIISSNKSFVLLGLTTSSFQMPRIALIKHIGYIIERHVHVSSLFLQGRGHRGFVEWTRKQHDYMYVRMHKFLWCMRAQNHLFLSTHACVLGASGRTAEVSKNRSA